MIKIEEVKRNKKSYTLTVNGETLKNVNVEVALSYGIREGEIEEERYREFLKENARQNAKAYLYTMLSRKARTVKEARDRLYEKGYHKDAVEYAITTVSSYGYLNDEQYVENFIENALRNKGSFRVKRELKDKGIESSLIENATLGIDVETEEEACVRVATKYLKGKSFEDEKTRERLFRHLVSRGYSYEIIKHALRALSLEIDEN